MAFDTSRSGGRSSGEEAPEPPRKGSPRRPLIPDQTLSSDSTIPATGASPNSLSLRRLPANVHFRSDDGGIIDEVREIAAYNEVDCRVMAEILGWLRVNR